MLGFGRFESAARFCAAFDELRQYAACSVEATLTSRCQHSAGCPLRWRGLIAEMAAA